MKHQSAKEFCRGLKRYKRFLLSCHMIPEGDAIGSLLALDSMLRRLGKKTTVVCEDSFPDRLHCLPSSRWHRAQDLHKKPEDFDARKKPAVKVDPA